MHVVVTGCAGFIGFHLSLRLLKEGHSVVGVDVMNDYYSVQLKEDRLKQLTSHPQFTFHQVDVADAEALAKISSHNVTHIVHLAAQAGVRYSLINPYIYGHSNMMGQLCILEWAKSMPKLEHMVYASTSSVYGALATLPFSIDQRTDSPVSLYAATKKACETLAESYHRMYGLPITGLRYFTVYGPWGRPDMALFVFTDKMLKGEEIAVFHQGKMQRNFTYVDDIVDGTLKALGCKPSAHQLYNIGNSRSEELMDYIHVLEAELGIKARIKFEPLQPGDIPATEADISQSVRDFGFSPKTNIQEGIAHFVKWYRQYHDA